MSRPSANPSLGLLATSKTSHARSKIKNYFRKQRFTANIARGRELIQKELDRLHLDSKALMQNDVCRVIVDAMNLHTVDDLLAQVGRPRDIAVGTILTRLRYLTQHDQHHQTIPGKKSTNNAKLHVGGDLEDVAIIRSKCCQPVPGDEVTGYMTRGKGSPPSTRLSERPPLSTDRTRPLPRSRLEAHRQQLQRFLTDIKVELADRIGLLEDVGKLFSEAKTNIQAIRTRSLPNHTAIMQISFDAADTTHIAVMTRLHDWFDVMDIHRVGANE